LSKGLHARLELACRNDFRPAAAEPNPWGDTPVNECFRGLATAIDESGVLWLCDKVIPIRGSERD
jgi:hypothetical protein